MNNINRLWIIGIIAILTVSFYPGTALAEGNSAQDILRQGLLGAATGAISSELSGGKAGKGALIGAGTNVIGGALLGFLTNSPSSNTQNVSYSQPSYSQPYQSQVVYNAPVHHRAIYAQPEMVYAEPAPTYYTQPQTDSNKTILRQGLLGAGVGAISASASGGKAGTGALVGAGTNVIGGALLDTLFTSPASTSARPVYYVYNQPAPTSNAWGSQTHTTAPRKHIVRKFDNFGKVISEEEFWE